MSEITLDSPLDQTVGSKNAKDLHQAFRMRTVRDLIEHYPRRYGKHGILTPLQFLPPGEHVSVIAEVRDVTSQTMRNRPGILVTATITDGTGSLTLTWFNQRWRKDQLRIGARGIFAGKVGEYQGKLQLTHPEYVLFDEDAQESEEAEAWMDRPLPIYPATEKFPTWRIEAMIKILLDRLGSIPDPIPQDILDRGGSKAPIMGLRESYEMIHRPRTDLDRFRAAASLKFREAFTLTLGLQHRKRDLSDQLTAPWPRTEGGLLATFNAQLPFTLTDDQAAVGEVLSEELARTTPMHRLLQGEVASGKTLVALRAMLQVAEHSGQSALLAPTEVLAAQHVRSIIDTLGPELVEAVHPTLLTGQMPAAERRRALLDIAAGKAKIVVGTHALMSETTTFADLGFVVIDEQHRFGVEQREALRQKGRTPHLLVMTATPIPRTIALTAFGDLETSTIKQLPPGRPGTDTHTVPLTEHPSWLDRAWTRASEEIAEGRQVYVVCPAISSTEQEEGGTTATNEDLTEEAWEYAAGDSGDTPTTQAPRSATRGMANVEDTIEELRNHPALQGTVIAQLTGAMTSADKEAVMVAFQRGDIDLLVATTVIEVGVNVPNASMMIIRDAERFGISQLHQLRGRVGRGKLKGLCLLLTNAEEGSIGRERVEVVASSTDGFELAEKDLVMRREGDILGTAQSGGASSLKLLRVTKDPKVIDRANTLAAELIERDPELASVPTLRKIIDATLGDRIENLEKS